MWRKEIELVLARQLSTYLAMPVFITDIEGHLLFYNESAEQIIGRPFDEAEDIPARELGSIFQTTDEGGAAIPSEELPINIALVQRQPAHRRFLMKGMDGNTRLLEATAIPLIGISGRFLGAFSVFWEVQR